MQKLVSPLLHRGPVGITWELLNRSWGYNALWNTLTSRLPIGTNVFDRDWELLILADTGRPDGVRELLPSHQWLKNVGTIHSVGSSSPEWYLNTFTEEHAEAISKTALISANIYAHRVLNEWTEDTTAADDLLKNGYPSWQQVSSDDLAHFEQITGTIDHYDTLHSESSATANIVTDRAINVARNHGPDRLIVHYTLPHLPFIADALDWKPGELSTEQLMAGPTEQRELQDEETGYRAYAYGDVPRADAYQNHLANLRLLFDYINILRKNIKASPAIISADHGEALGEWGLWDHQHGFPFSPMRIAPWARIKVEDRGTYQSQYDAPGRLPDEAERRKFLEQMGYL